jgi:hypothetical protein
MFQCTVNRIINDEVKEVFNELLTQDNVFDGENLGLDTILFDIAIFNFEEKTLVVKYKPTVDKINNSRSVFPQWTGFKDDGEKVVIKVYRDGQDTIKVSDYEQVHCKIDGQTSVSFTIYEHVEESQFIHKEQEMIPMSDDEDEPDQKLVKEESKKLVEEHKHNGAKKPADEDAAAKKLAEEQAKKAADEEAAKKLAEEQAKKAAEEEATKKLAEEQAKKAAEEETKRAAEEKKVRIETETKIVEKATKEMVDAMDKIRECNIFMDDLSEKVFNDWTDKKITYAHAWVTHVQQKEMYEEHKKGLMMDLEISKAFHSTTQPLYNMYLHIAKVHNQREDVKQKIAKNAKTKKVTDDDASGEAAVVDKTAKGGAGGSAPRKALCVNKVLSRRMNKQVAAAPKKRKHNEKAPIEKKTKKAKTSDETKLVASGRNDAPVNLMALMKMATANKSESETSEEDTD